MTRQSTSFGESRHGLVTTTALVTIFWLIAVGAVATAHSRLDPLSPSSGAVASIAAIVICAFAYTRVCARQAGVSHALSVGIAWLVLGIVTEIVVTAHLGHVWVSILGSPDRPLLRNIFLFAWIFAPAIFARRESDDGP